MEEKSKKKVIHSRTDQGWYFRDFEGFTPAQQNMIVEWWPYAMAYFKNYVKKYDNVPADVFYDAITEALMFCVRTYMPDGGASFKTYFFTGARLQVSKHVRRWRISTGRTVSENKKIKNAECNNPLDQSELKDLRRRGSVEWEDDVCSKLFVDDMISKLTTQKQRDVVTRIYIYGEKPIDVARSYGVSKQAINVVLNGAYRTMRKYLGCDSQEGRLKVGKQCAAQS